MRFSEDLAKRFQADINDWAKTFFGEMKLGDLESDRFLARSVLPHVEQLLSRFVAAKDWSQYWKETSNPENLRAAYLMAFGWANQFRISAVWAELHRLGFRFDASAKRAIEWGAGTAAAPTGVAWAEREMGLGLPSAMTWALLERDQAALRFGAQWSEFVLQKKNWVDWEVQTFHRTLDPSREWLPRTAPKFSLWMTSFFLNELWEKTPIEILAKQLLSHWEKHLEERGLVILIEPALPAQSRKLLELRAALIPGLEKIGMQVLLPCLGHQACGALTRPKDFCHEEVSWWRPDLVARIDRLAGMDRKTLDMSYLVLTRDKRSREMILPGLPQAPRQRLVSPATRRARDSEFFYCGEGGKKRGRMRESLVPERLGGELERGDILGQVDDRGAADASRIEGVR